MDDERTQQTLDDLAELFLTGTAPQRATPARRAAAPRPQPTGPAAASTLDGPPPIKLRPKPALHQPSASSSATPFTPSPQRSSRPPAADRPRPSAGPTRSPRSAQGRPTLRFTGDGPDPAPAIPRGGGEARRPSAAAPATVSPPNDREAHAFLHPRPAVEAVLLGNLPGMAGAWLTQYAQLLAQRDGPVALLYVDADAPGGAIEAELIEPTLGAVLAPGPDPRGGDGPDHATSTALNLPPKPTRTFADVLAALARAGDAPLSAVLIHTDSDPRELSRLLDVGVWTVLSGADETAIAAAAALLKNLVRADAAAAGLPVGVFILGADESRATAAAARLCEDTAGLLETPVEMLGYLQKMTPVALRDLGRFTGLTDRWAELSTWLQTWPEDAPTPGTSPAQAATTFTEPRPAPDPGPVLGEAEPHVAPAPTAPVTGRPPASPAAPPRPKLPPLPEPVRVEAGSKPGDKAPVTAALVPAVAIREALRRERSAVPGTPDLVALLGDTPAALPGLAALAARCPAQPGIQLATDDRGRLHLLAHHDSAAGPDAALPSAALLQLRDAGAWAREHYALLALTAPSRMLDPAADPVLHLFTDRADLAVPLAAKLGPALRLHLLQPLELAGESLWYCTPLSR